MYASVSRRKSQGSASVSSAGTGGGRGAPLTTAERDRKRGDESFQPGSTRHDNARGIGCGAMSVGGSSATTTPRSSVATTPLSTPRGGRKEKDAKDARGEDKEKMIN
jgi:hypothetical protein